MDAERNLSRSDDIDLVTLGRAVWGAKKWILGLALTAGFLTFVGLSMVRPLYTSEARILIENEDSTYRRPTGEPLQQQARSLDEQTIQSQVQVLSSRDLAIEVIKKLDLVNNPEFAKDAGLGFVSRTLRTLGIGFGSDKSEQEKAANAFDDHLLVYQLSKSSVIAVSYTSGDPALAAQAANALAESYIEWQRSEKLKQTRDATAWLSSQIEALRPRVLESEQAVEAYRAEEGIFSGSNNTGLSAQQLSELNSKLILARAQKSEAEARARLIRKMLAEKGDIDSMPDVLSSQLINRLIEQRVQVQRQLAELSATLLPSHPRILQLNSELANMREQIREEANKIVQGLENEAQVADARVKSLVGSLRVAKSQASGESAAEVKVRALEREAKSNRDLLESYLARYRDASSRHDVGSVPADATIVSKAYASTKPSFPRRGPITILVMVAVALLTLGYILARELINATASPRAARPGYRRAPELSPAPSHPVHADAPRPEPELAPSEARPTPAGEDKDDQDAAGLAGNLADIVSRFRQRAPMRLALEGPKVDTPSEPRFDLEEDASLEADAEPSIQDDPVAPEEVEHAIPREISDLDAYLRKRMQSPAPSPARPSDLLAERRREHHQAPVVNDLDRLYKRLDGQLQWGSQGAIMVAPGTASNALPEAIQIARHLTEGNERVILLDVARGASTVSDFLGLPRSPGYSELAAGKASFEEVIRVDKESALQVIPAGDPAVECKDAMAIFMKIFSALQQTYDCVVIHTDSDRANLYGPVLGERLAALVTLFAPGTVQAESTRCVKELDGFDCPVFLYERKAPAQPTSKGVSHKLRFFDRLAAG